MAPRHNQSNVADFSRSDRRECADEKAAGQGARHRGGHEFGQHLEIGLEAVRIIREGGVEQLHSRKLRSFDEPAFRQARRAQEKGPPARKPAGLERSVA